MRRTRRKTARPSRERACTRACQASPRQGRRTYRAPYGPIAEWLDSPEQTANRDDCNRAHARSRTPQQPRQPQRSRDATTRAHHRAVKKTVRYATSKPRGRGGFPVYNPGVVDRPGNTSKNTQNRAGQNARHQTSLLRLGARSRSDYRRARGKSPRQKSSAAPYLVLKVFSSTTVIWVRCASIALRLVVPSP